MGRKRIELKGKRFGRLVVQDYIGKNEYGHLLWRCKCDCGNEKIVTSAHLLSGDVSSCGCWLVEFAKSLNYKHGKTNTKLFSVWSNMHRRCEQKSAKGYNRYGGRGISICKEWDSFETFYNWAIENGYQEDLTLDRIDNNGNYEPSNCRWADKKVQANNRRSNVCFEINNEKLTLAQIAEKYNIDYLRLQRRVTKYGWDIQRAITTPIVKNQRKRK